MSKPKSRSLVRAYGIGFKYLLLGALGLVGTVFAWRAANALYDKLMTKKEQ